MNHFSKVQRLQTLEMGENVLALPIIFHLISYSASLSLSSHICLLRVVSVLWCSCSNPVLWFDHLALKVVPVSPTYVFSSFSDLTVAWYITFSIWQLPSRGQGYLEQLHFFCGAGVSFFCNIFLLCADIIFLMFAVVL